MTSRPSTAARVLSSTIAMTLPQLHIRDLFWLVLVLVVALGCGWWLDRERQTSELERLTIQYYVGHSVSIP